MKGFVGVADKARGVTEKWRKGETGTSKAGRLNHDWQQ